MTSIPIPYLTIWTKPRFTFETFFYERFSQTIYGLPFIIYGVSFGLNMGPDIFLLFDENIELHIKLLTYLLTSAVGILLIYLVFGILNPWIMKLVGKIWKGEASSSELANVYSLAGIPYCLVLIYQIFLLVFGEEPTLTNVNAGFFFIILILEFRLLVIGVSIAQKISFRLALLNILMTYLPFLILKLSIAN